ncbi:MAG TPA: AAA family ATPase [Planctomycetota bacterium]|nr:AAA family ATPase [Planctomycetota bacterium]
MPVNANTKPAKGYELTPEQDRIVRKYVAWYSAANWTLAKAGKRIGCAASTLSQIINGTYPSDPARFLRAMAACLQRAEGESRSNQRPPAVLTSIVEEVHGILDDCLNGHRMAFICGRSGVGKTVACELFAEQHPLDTVMITCSKGVRDADVLRRVADHLELPWGGTLTEMFDRITSSLITGGRPLLIVDECDFLGHSLHIVRQLHDQADCGLVLVGTPAFLPLLKRHRTGTEGQALGRITHFVNLDRIVEDDARAILAPFGLASDALRLAWQGCAGNARRLVNGLLVAASIADGAPIGPAHVAAAFERLLPVEL